MMIEKLKKEVDNPAQSIKIECEYDLQGRRRLNRVTENNILTQHEYYLYDGFLQIVALDVLNNQQPKHDILWYYTQGKATKPLALLKGNKTYACCCDFYKNVTELIDLNHVPSTDPNEFDQSYKVHFAEIPTQTNIVSAQNQNALASSSPIVARYDYAPFGKITKAIGQADLSPLRFSSQVFDPETALTYFNYRYYNPTDGRWISRDPVGESASINLYSVVNNVPTYLNDYLGLRMPFVDPPGLPLEQNNIYFINPKDYDDNINYFARATTAILNYGPLIKLDHYKDTISYLRLPSETECLNKVSFYVHGGYVNDNKESGVDMPIGGYTTTTLSEREFVNFLISIRDDKLIHRCKGFYVKMNTCSIGRSEKLKKMIEDEVGFDVSLSYGLVNIIGMDLFFNLEDFEKIWNGIKNHI